MKITVKLLKKLEACPKQVARFERYWPDGANVTKVNCLIAVKHNLDIGWIAHRVLKGRALKVYVTETEKALDKYDRRVLADVNAYYKIRAIAFYDAVKLQEREK